MIDYEDWMTDAIDQHAREIAQTKGCWERKPLLRRAYAEFHNIIKQHLACSSGLTVELGSGIGVIKETIPECITTDLFPNPMVDQIENAYALSFADNLLSNLILFDVWHHLQYPGSALDEFYRVLKPNGRLILFEPAAHSWLGRLVYGCFHHEPIHDQEELVWHLPTSQDPENLPYYAAQGNAWKLFAKAELPGELQTEWRMHTVSFFPAFAWLAAGGFRKRQLLPDFSYRPMDFISNLAKPFPLLFATRMLVVLEKNDKPSKT